MTKNKPIHKGLQTAYNKGYQAGIAGLPRTACPYADDRTYNGRVTFSRAFLRRWIDGWNQGNAERTQPVATCSCGFKLLVLPDVVEMRKAINNHIKEKNCAPSVLDKAVMDKICEIEGKTR